MEKVVTTWARRNQAKTITDPMVITQVTHAGIRRRADAGRATSTSQWAGAGAVAKTDRTVAPDAVNATSRTSQSRLADRRGLAGDEDGATVATATVRARSSAATGELISWARRSSRGDARAATRRIPGRVMVPESPNEHRRARGSRDGRTAARSAGDTLPPAAARSAGGPGRGRCGPRWCCSREPRQAAPTSGPPTRPGTGSRGHRGSSGERPERRSGHPHQGARIATLPGGQALDRAPQPAGPAVTDCADRSPAPGGRWRKARAAPGGRAGPRPASSRR